MLEIYGQHKLKCDHPDCNRVMFITGYITSVVDSAYDKGFKLSSDGIHWFCKDHATDHVCFETVKEAINKSV